MDTNSHVTRSPSLKTLNVVHVGSGYGQRGGVASVLKEIEASKDFFRSEGVLLSFFETRGFKKISNVLLFFIIDIPRFFLAIDRRIEIVHFHVSANGSFYRKYIFFIIARLRKKKTLFHWHSNNLEEFRSSSGAMLARALSKFVGNADAVVGVSREMSQDLANQRGGRRGVYTIGNSAQAAENAVQDRPDINSSSNGKQPYIAFAARFVREKGIADLFGAIALLKKEGLSISLKLAGTGDTRDWEKLVRELQIQDRVSFVGWLSGEIKMQFYRNSLAFCLPSYREPFGIVTLEAMFCSVAVIGTKRGGFLDLVEEGVTGYLVEPLDPKALAVRIRTLVEDPRRAREMGAAGLERARRLYSNKTISCQYIRCYRDIAENRGKNLE
jgi:glycosyltransferase involved in cell wall biosynthesis